MRDAILTNISGNAREYEIRTHSGVPLVVLFLPIPIPSLLKYVYRTFPAPNHRLRQIQMHFFSYTFRYFEPLCIKGLDDLANHVPFKNI